MRPVTKRSVSRRKRWFMRVPRVLIQFQFLFPFRVSVRPVASRNGCTVSGETENNVSGWTVDTLHAHVAILTQQSERAIEQLRLTLDERYQHLASMLLERHVTMTTSLQERYETQTKAVDTAFSA